MSDYELDRSTFDFLALGGLLVCSGCGRQFEVGDRCEVICTATRIGDAPTALSMYGPPPDPDRPWTFFNLIHRDCEWTSG